MSQPRSGMSCVSAMSKHELLRHERHKTSRSNCSHQTARCSQVTDYTAMLLPSQSSWTGSACLAGEKIGSLARDCLTRAVCRGLSYL